jgi:DtxR family Mn-dependent transcriptional regulator
MYPPLTKSEREALKAIYRLARNGNDVHTGDVAGSLKLSPGTVTATVKRLAERGLLDHKLYKGVELTAAGQGAAVAAIRRHRIVERFLADLLGYAWSDADRLAQTFEHSLPQEVDDRLYVALDCPTSCPHGFPIPAPEVAEIPMLPPLYDLEPGDVATLALPGSTDPAVVEFLETLGLRPGVEVKVLEKHPFDGPLVVRVGDHERTLGDKVARQIYVKTDDSPADDGETIRREQSA